VLIDEKQEVEDFDLMSLKGRLLGLKSKYYLDDIKKRPIRHVLAEFKQ
jgi:hypothetical protein